MAAISFKELQVDGWIALATSKDKEGEAVKVLRKAKTKAGQAILVVETQDGEETRIAVKDPDKKQYVVVEMGDDEEEDLGDDDDEELDEVDTEDLGDDDDEDDAPLDLGDDEDGEEDEEEEDEMSEEDATATYRAVITSTLYEFSENPSGRKKWTEIRKAAPIGGTKEEFVEFFGIVGMDFDAKTGTVALPAFVVKEMKKKSVELEVIAERWLEQVFSPENVDDGEVEEDAEEEDAEEEEEAVDEPDAVILVPPAPSPESIIPDTPKKGRGRPKKPETILADIEELVMQLGNQFALLRDALK